MDDSTSNPDEYMEDQNSNELNQSIAAWRRQLLASEAIQPEDADELETHLRASVTQLMEQGLSPDEALLVAQRRLGAVEQVQGEFEKINEHRYWGHRFLWMIVGYLGISLVMTSIKLAASISVLFGKFYALNGIQMGWMHNIATLALFTAFMTGLYGVSTGTIQLPYLRDKMHQYNNRVKIIAFVILSYVVFAFDIGSTILVAKIHNINEIGQYYLVTNYLGLFIRIVIPLVWIFIAYKIWQRNHLNYTRRGKTTTC